MDPNLFRLDWEQVGEVLATIVVLAFVLERALSLLFENKTYVQKLGEKPVKEIIAFSAALLVCWRWQLDGISVILHGEKMTFLGEVVTAGVIAGGSKGALKLFRDVMGVENEVAKAARETRVKRSQTSSGGGSNDAPDRTQ